MSVLRNKVWKFAFASRLFVIGLQCASNLLIPDHEAKVFSTPPDPNDPNELYDYIPMLLLGGLSCWDAQYFQHIAKNGYTYENTLAFFPLLPITTQLLANTLLSPLNLFFTQHNLLLVAFTIINVFCFAKTALLLYYLSLVVLKDDELAYRSAIFFCLNPASIFFTAPYSESMFALCTFSGLLCSALEQTKSSTFYFALSSATRSNGILNIGFTIHRELRKLYCQVSAKNSVFYIPVQVSITSIKILISVALSLTPFILFQMFSFNKYCTTDDHKFIPELPTPDFIINHAFDNGYKLPSKEFPTWCNHSIPLAYSYVQDQYWDVGFLNYYELKQTPNFLLAFPAVFIILYSSIKFFFLYPRHCRFLGFPITKPPVQGKNRAIKTIPPEAFIYIAHAFCLTVFCVLCIHVQVTTRMLASSSPVLYWFAAYLSQPYTKPDEKPTKEKQTQNAEYRSNLHSKWKVFLLTDEPTHIRGKLIKYYFLSYMVIGTILFSNHYPWT